MKIVVATDGCGKSFLAEKYPEKYVNFEISPLKKSSKELFILYQDAHINDDIIVFLDVIPFLFFQDSLKVPFKVFLPEKTKESLEFRKKLSVAKKSSRTKPSLEFSIREMEFTGHSIFWLKKGEFLGDYLEK